MLAFSIILDLKDSTVSLSYRASGEKLVFLPIFVYNCHPHVNKQHTFLVAFALNIELLDIFNHIWAFTRYYPKRWLDPTKKDNNGMI